jgi:hypothetical protein
MERRHNDNTTAESCEMLQEIYGLGANYLLREDEEKVFQRLMLKYHRKASGLSKIDLERATEEKQVLALLIRKALSHRKMELKTWNRPPRKESLLSVAAGAATGISDKRIADSATARGKTRPD